MEAQEQQDPFASVEPDPLTPGGDDLPPGVEQGTLGGTDLTPEPEPEAAVEEPQPVEAEVPAEEPETPEEPAVEGVDGEPEYPPASPVEEPEPEDSPAPPEEEPVEDVAAAPEPEPQPAKGKGKGKKGGNRKRRYVILEQKKDGSFDRIKVGREDTISAANVMLATTAAARTFGPGFKANWLVIPESFFKVKPVNNETDERVRVKVG